MTNKKIKDVVEEVTTFADRLSDAYSTDAYRGGWGSCIKALRKRGLNDLQIEAIIRSKWTRWAGDSSESNRYGSYTSSDLIKYMDRNKKWSQIDNLVCETLVQNIKITSNVKHNGRECVKITMKDAKEYFISRKEAEDLANWLFASVGKIILESCDIKQVNK